MSKYTDYVKTGANKFVELQDTPDTYDPGKYVKVESNGLNYGDVDATISGINDSGGGLNYKYLFDTATSGTIASGTVQFNNTNYRAASKINISYFDKDRADLTTWIDSWDDSDKSVKGTATFKAVRDDSKYVTYKLKETGGSMFGDGSDGAVVVSGTVNLNTTALAAGRTYPDMVSYNVSSVGSSSCQTTATPNGIAAGDAVLLINLQGASNSQINNVGNYEFFTVDSVVDTTIVFKESKTKNYGNNGGDTNLGTADSNQKVMLMRVPQYSSITIVSGGTLTTSAWSGTKDGVCCFKCSGTTDIRGSLTVDGLGFRSSASKKVSGGSYGRKPTYDSNQQPNLGGGGGTGFSTGGSGGYATRGGSYEGVGGYTYGISDLSKIYLGSAAGGPTNKKGAGMIIIVTKELMMYGSITCKGAASASGGSGGSVLINANKVTMNSATINAKGGIGTRSSGGDGRVAIYHNILMDSFSNVSPTPYTSDLVIAGSSTEYNAEWLNGSGTFDDEEEVFVSYSYNY